MNTLDVIHYSRTPDWEIRPIQVKNQFFVKPEGGLWTTPTSATYGWKEWCTEENFHPENLIHPVYLKLDRRNILTIDSLEDAQEYLPWCSPPFTDSKFLTFPDYEKMVQEGIDGIHLTQKGEQETRFSHPYSLYGWDCECVLVLQNRCILETTKGFK